MFTSELILRQWIWRFRGKLQHFRRGVGASPVRLKGVLSTFSDRARYPAEKWESVALGANPPNSKCPSGIVSQWWWGLTLAMDTTAVCICFSTGKIAAGWILRRSRIVLLLCRSNHWNFQMHLVKSGVRPETIGYVLEIHCFFIVIYHTPREQWPLSAEFGWSTSIFFLPQNRMTIPPKKKNNKFHFQWHGPRAK